MSDIQRIGDLELNQDLDFQRRSWKVQRIGWALMALVVVAAALGLLGGSGLLSDTIIGSETDELQIRYHRFLRQGKPVTLDIQAWPADDEKQVKIQLDRDYLNHFKLDQVVPEPSQTEAHSETLIFTFDLAQPGDSVEIKFDMRPEFSGAVSGHVGIENGPSLEISHFVLP